MDLWPVLKDVIQAMNFECWSEYFLMPLGDNRIYFVGIFMSDVKILIIYQQLDQ